MSNIIKQINDLQPSCEELRKWYEKDLVINEIAQYHPSSGTEHGWSWYVGGMKDDGGWYKDVMRQADIKLLEVFLEKLRVSKASHDKYIEEQERIWKLPKEEQDEIYRQKQEKLVIDILKSSSGALFFAKI